MRRICSKKSNDFVANVRKLKNLFKERGYPEGMTNKETKRALESSLLDHSKTSERSVSGNCETGVPLVVNYNPILCFLGQIIHKNIFLYQHEDVNKYLTLSPLLHFVSVRTLSSHLVRVKVYPVGERLAGSNNK